MNVERHKPSLAAFLSDARHGSVRTLTYCGVGGQPGYSRGMYHWLNTIAPVSSAVAAIGSLCSAIFSKFSIDQAKRIANDQAMSLYNDRKR